jgi:RNA polymerase subunit RPABC4/transcription elongation factor Spt4
MKCHHCGNIIPQTATFCAYCGERSHAAPIVTPSRSTTAADTEVLLQRRSGLSIWAKRGIVSVLVALLAVGGWLLLGSGGSKIKAIEDFVVTSKDSFLEVSFLLMDAENNFVPANGEGLLTLYDNAGKSIYQEQFQFAKGDFIKHPEYYEYSRTILKDHLEWVVPEADDPWEQEDFNSDLVRYGQAVLQITPDKGQTSLNANDPAVTLLSASEADTIIEQINEKYEQERLELAFQQVKEGLTQWLWENRYSISEFGSFGYALDLDVDDIAIVERQAWAVGYLHGIGGYGCILHSLDGGKTWEVQWQSSTWGPDPFEVEFLDEREGWVGADEVILHTLDSGDTWSAIWYKQGGFSSGLLRELKVIDRQNLWGRLANGNIIESTDGGSTWEVRTG